MINKCEPHSGTILPNKKSNEELIYTYERICNNKEAICLSDEPMCLIQELACCFLKEMCQDAGGLLKGEEGIRAQGLGDRSYVVLVSEEVSASETFPFDIWPTS
jgi:hypothetical protein